MSAHEAVPASLAEPAQLRSLVNVADTRLGAQALSASDDFFAPKERMLQPGEPQWREGVYDEHGKWMDGWESRRRREPGHDFCIIKLAAPAMLQVLEIDTRYFTGNYPPYAAVQACRIDGTPDAGTVWTPLLPQSPLRGDQRQWFELSSMQIFTHLKLDIIPDGGIARFRAWGRVYRDWSLARGELLDLAAALNGGRALACSDEHYGSMRNLLLPGRGASMAEGWETRRRRGPGHDWVILALGRRGRIEHIEIDTAHFKGNFPHQVSLHAALLDVPEDADLTTQCLYWPLLLEPQYLKADSPHRYDAQLRALGPVSHVRVNIHPDGGLSRVRLFGRPDA
jgi:allantoicase